MKKKLTLGMSLIPIISLIGAAALSIFIWKSGMHIPLMIGVIAAAIVSIIAGWSWDDIQKMMVNGVARALPAVFILLIIGIIVGTWIASGVIPTMIYYGLSIIEPSMFIPIVALVTGIISITLGSSFTSIATIGLAFMAIGEGLGFSPGLVAGAVISGAYFGDKLSPLSDTTNIAPAMAETDLFSHVKHMLWDTIPAFVISIVMYWVVSQSGAANSGADTNVIDVMKTGLNNIFVIHPLLLLMPVLTIILMIKRTPAIPALMGVSILGGVLAIFVQGSSVTSVIQTMTSGYHAESSVKALDSLLNRGGLMSMLGTIGLLILATALGGILEETGSFDVLTNKMMSKVHSTGSLISTTILSTFIVAFASGAQFLAIILPARTFVKDYKKMGIDTKNLSRCVEAAGTVGINLVPWGVPAVFAAGILGVSPGEFIPFAFFAFLVPLMNILFGFTGWTITKKNYEHVTKEKRSASL
ncbi:Na+/H+ antiporter NhaC [Neobacillus bataviensis LMG 21833]|uniref:Na+/H+ antiporter NhaC n=1 Tax=Neobacillus bataviensis LMG 21833 TaxID=1117379 RepID=K6D6P4_9BACI|nr:Na+/H+ antiporter NhaC [Neobacillus bataviensis]EKN63728.1 Na+/H+ antiporter NhaC [Neobacillus bataviensis LMG 21833]